MDKVKFLTEQNIQDIVAFIVEDERIDYDKAIDKFYSSETFEKLSDSSTGLYRESAAYVYELYKNEQINGTIKQSEQ